MIKFGVVMSVYYDDSPTYFLDAVDSLLEQTLKPDQIVIAVDGLVGVDLDHAIKKVSKLSIVEIIRIEVNVGSGAAKRIGISYIKHSIIAIMDSDDISLPLRFEKQVQFFKTNNIDVVGGWISEFDNNPGDLTRVRRVPSSHRDIIKLAKWLNPINHVSLMFTKESYDRAGGYPVSRSCEDWELIVRMLTTDSKIHNLPEPLVNVRTGFDMIKRRKTKSHLNAEINLFCALYKLRFIHVHELIINIIIRVAFRAIPKWLTLFLYERVLRF